MADGETQETQTQETQAHETQAQEHERKRPNPPLDVPGWLRERLERAGAVKAREAILAELGIGDGDIEAAKAAIEKARASETETQRLARERETLAKQLAERERKLAALETERRERELADQVSEMVRAYESEHGALWDRDLVVALLTGRPLPSRIAHGDGGLMVVGAEAQPVQDYVRSFLSQRPYLARPMGPGGGSRIASTASAAVEKKQQTTTEQAQSIAQWLAHRSRT